MKKIINLRNFVWILVIILFLISALKIISENRKTEVKTDWVTVLRIIDGDTLVVKINNEEETVRLIGIDTPETKDSRKEVECFGNEATGRAEELLKNRKVKLESDNTQDNRDIYNRLLRYIYLEDGTLVNKKLIEEGFGLEYTYKIPYKFQIKFREAEKKAQENKIGIWNDNACLNF